ncbi:hypothetical protein DITRI_Ditri04bG0077200 [Diplodiscus trichospermus]
MISCEDAPMVVAGVEVPIEKSELLNLKSQDGFNSVLSKFGDLNIDENLEHAREDLIEILISLVHQIKDLEKQLKDRKVWAYQKVMQAARKLSCDLTELKMLRMKREEMQWIRKKKHTKPYSTTKNLSKVENALRNVCEQLNLANAAVRRLETENAKIIADIEASKLIASKSLITYLENAKREKNY